MKVNKRESISETRGNNRPLISQRRSTRIAQQKALKEGTVPTTVNTPRRKRQARSSSTPLRNNPDKPTRIQFGRGEREDTVSDIENNSDIFSEQEYQSTERGTVNEADGNPAYSGTFNATVYAQENTIIEMANAQAVVPHPSEYNAKFEGDKFGGDPNKLDSFLRKYRTHAKACRWSDEAMHERLPLYLSDTAEDMYLDRLNDATVNGPNNWEQDEAFLKESFPIMTTETQRFNALHARKQGRHESFQDYANALTKLARDVITLPSQLISLFGRGIRFKPTAQYLALEKPETLQKAVQMAQAHAAVYDIENEEQLIYTVEQLNIQEEPEQATTSIKAHIPKGHELNKPIKTKPNIYNDWQGSNLSQQQKPQWRNNNGPNNRGFNPNRRYNNGPQGSNQQSTNNKDERVLTCFRCRKTGHWARDCTQIITCDVCGKMGHSRIN